MRAAVRADPRWGAVQLNAVDPSAEFQPLNLKCALLVSPLLSNATCTPLHLGHEQLDAVQENLQRIVSGHNHVVAITEEGSLYVWGRNDRGQLGLGYAGSQDIRTRFKPTLLEITNGNGQKQEVIDVAVGLEHTMVVVNGGRVFAWGSNQYGQLGIDEKPEIIPYTSVPTAIDIGGESIMNVSAAAGHSVALTFTGAVYTWGANQEGQLGLGGCRNPEGRGLDPCLDFMQKPTKILQTGEGSFLPQMKLIAAGGHIAGGAERFLEGGHTVTVSKVNEVWGWGDNFHGQVGASHIQAVLFCLFFVCFFCVARFHATSSYLHSFATLYFQAKSKSTTGWQTTQKCSRPTSLTTSPENITIAKWYV